MTRRVARWWLCSVLALGLFGLPAVPVAAEPADPLALAEDLKSAALAAIRQGKFDQSTDLLVRAADLTKDPVTVQMANWVQHFEQQRQRFAQERRKQFDEAVADVRLLLDNGYVDYALEAAAKAYLLAEDKDAFRAEPWVDNLVSRAVKQAEDYDQNEQWVRALRLYSSLGSIEPINPVWKDRLKRVTRRIRLLALYAPEELKRIQESDADERKAVEALLEPTTQPSANAADATKGTPGNPAAAADNNEAEADHLGINWQEALARIKLRMLRDSLEHARQNYWRDITYRDLIVGGLQGMQTLVTTSGLERSFEGLADPAKRQQFEQFLQTSLQRAQNLANPDDRDLLRMLNQLAEVNTQTINLPEEVLVSEFADGAFGSLDPFSTVIWPTDLDEFQKTTQGEFSGVGIQIQSDDDGSLRVVSPLEDSPAYRAGIKAGDIVTHIDGRSAKGITLNQAVKRITGERGTTVVLTVRSQDGTVRDYAIRRDIIKVASVKGWIHRPGGGWDYFIDPDNRIGYVRLTNFTRTTSDDLKEAMKTLRAEGARGLILDLRYNPGGLLQAATEVADMFLDGGTIVSTRADRHTPNPPTVTIAHHDKDEFDLPTVVLVNQYSASASEIVSGALKDQGRALIVGERTFGKGSVQMLFPLSNREAYLKLTTSHYYLPNGRCIHREENSQEWGVDPDVVIEMTPEQMRAAIDARQELDVLRSADTEAGDRPKIEAPEGEVTVEGGKLEVKMAATEKKDPLAADPQLGAALLLLRLQVATGAM